MNALVSVYIITCNRVNLLKRCVESVLRQSYHNLDIIIVDDFSDDNTKDYLHFISKKDNRIRYVLNQKRLGACGSRNVAIKLAKGEFITGCDDDDYYQPSRINDFVKNKHLLDNNKILFTHILWKTSQGIKFPALGRFSPESISADDLLYHNFIGNQIFTRTEVLKVHLFDEDFPAWQDIECWYRILKENDCTAIRIRDLNYIQDVSHEEERISTGKKDRILKAYALFCSKYNLSNKERLLLTNNLFNYRIGHGYFFHASFYLIFSSFRFFTFVFVLRNFKILFLKKSD